MDGTGTKATLDPTIPQMITNMDTRVKAVPDSKLTPATKTGLAYAITIVDKPVRRHLSTENRRELQANTVTITVTITLPLGVPVTGAAGVGKTALDAVLAENGFALVTAAFAANVPTVTVTAIVITNPYIPLYINPCFPPTAMVTKADGTPARVATLKEGDSIVATTANGELTTDTVSLLSLAIPDAEATFLTLETDAKKTLTLTPTHHVPTGAVCCSELKQAKELRTGDKMWMVGNDAAATPVTITKIGAAIETGTFSPVLAGGSFPVVDGLVTSFDAISKVSLKGSMPNFEAMLRATGTANLARRLIYGPAKFIDGFEIAPPAEADSQAEPSMLGAIVAAVGTAIKA